MKITNLLLSCLLLLCFAAKSQTADSLAGNWKFADMYPAANTDTGKLGKLREIFKDIHFSLNKDNTYSSFFMKQEDGNWSFDPELRQIIFIHEDREDRLKLLQLTPSQLILEMKNGKAIVLKRVLID